MNPELVSYLVGANFGLFLFIQYIVVYTILSRSTRDTKKVKRDLIYISLIGISVLLYGIFGSFSVLATSLSRQVIFFKLKLVSSVVTIVAFVNLLRFISVFIKDLGFVETDEYKENTKRYLWVFTIISVIIAGLILFTGVIVKNNLPVYATTGFLFILFLIAAGVIEVWEFSRILRKESGKITRINRIRFLTILWGGIVTVTLGILEVTVKWLKGVGHFSQIGSPYMYGVAFMAVSLSLNLMFEYMEVMERVSDSNKKLSELNKKIMDEIRTAQSLQISLLPIDKQREIQEFLDMEISYMPMQSVGGDYYDFYHLEDSGEVLILLGDASGHGVYAAMIWAMLKVEVEELIEERVFSDLAEAFTMLNKRITRILENTYSYATLFSCVVNMEKQTITYISAGHTDQLFYSSREKDVVKVRNKNPIVGTFKRAKYVADTISFTQGDVLLMFTDGVTEGSGPSGEQIGMARLENLFVDSCRGADSAALILGNIMAEMEEFTQGSMQNDDRTLMVIKL